MSLRHALGAACAAWFIGTSFGAAAQDSTSTPYTASTVAATSPEGTPPDDPLVCKRVTPTGSKISRKECRRQSEIDQDRRNARDSVDTIQRKAASQTTAIPDG